MLVKNIITAFALTGLATATPVGDIEERQTCAPAKNWCCSTAYPLSIFFIRGVGSNCRLRGSTLCGGRQAASLCCANNQILSGGTTSRDVVCTT
ncbi:hypothetical protein PENFLA_c036G04599 [Penicillium flavigenum]|uniref:Hydrophobin n=1 Tax=Penicillium flavigenum TaxID=254877 RepID=A0A1V6SKT1_9EURO|nr:hypothetical protein PENFLA_c036G04599 [Penicillium flavigenum]